MRSNGVRFLIVTLLRNAALACRTTVKFFLIGLFLFLLLKIYSVITQATLIAEEELKRIEEEEKRKNERECPFCLERCRKEAKVGLSRKNLS